MNIVGLAAFAFGYAVCYWAINILVDAHFRTAAMNPAPLSVLIGVPSSGTSASGTGGGAAQGDDANG